MDARLGSCDIFTLPASAFSIQQLPCPDINTKPMNKSSVEAGVECGTVSLYF